MIVLCKTHQRFCFTTTLIIRGEDNVQQQ